MYLKAALINEGMTVFNPGELKNLDPSVGLKAEECVWGHSLARLAEKLAEKRKELNLDEQIPDPRPSEVPATMTIREAFALFDPFFSELRYPHESPNVEGVGPEESEILNAVVERIRAFVKDV
jgi:hypothetical protein